MKRTFIFTIILVLTILTRNSIAQNIITFAGNGTTGFSGDGGMATAADMNSPYGIALDGAGNVYIADGNNQRIRKVNASGVITTIAGNGTSGFSGDGGAATAARLNYPSGVAVDAAGNIYIADASNQRIRKVNTSGIMSTIAGRGIMGFSGDGGAGTAAELDYPRGITVDGSGNVYFADQLNNRIRKISSTGIISTVAGDGTSGYSGDGGPATAAGLNSPAGVAIDNFGNLYIADESNQRVRMVSASTGFISTIAGTGAYGSAGDGYPATMAEVYFPKSVAVDGIGNVYIADEMNNKIRKVDPTGMMSTFAGNGTGGYSGDGAPATAAELDEPWYVVSDAKGNVFVADNYNDRVRMIGFYNYTPHFVNGTATTVNTCENTAGISLDSTLAIIDSNFGQTETWTLISAPVNGTAVTAYNTLSTGSVIYAAGVSYTPATGFSGTDSFQVQVSDGTATAIITVYVIVTPAPNAGSVEITGNICQGTTATLSSTATGGIWSVTNGAASISGTTLTGVAGGTDTVIYKVSNACGTAIASQVINVMNTVTPTITINTTATTICSGTSTTFTSTITNGGTTPAYQWMVNGITAGTGSSLTSSSLTTGDVVTCNLSSSAQCPTASTVTSGGIAMTVNALVTPAVTIVASADTLCTSGSVSYNATTTYGGTTPVLTWYVSGSAVGTGNSYAYTPANGDIVTCQLTSNAACAVSDTANSNNITMIVYSESAPAINVTSTVDSINYSGQYITFNAATAPGSVSYQWYLNGSPVTGATGATFTTPIYATDTVYCVGTVVTPCHNVLSSTSNAVTIYAKYLGVAPIANNFSQVALYPNPNTGSFNVSGTVNDASPATLTIYDMLGHVVYNTISDAVDGKIDQHIDMPATVSGNYIMHITTANSTATINFVVNR